MEDTTFVLLLALLIFIYSCAKLVFRYLRDTKMMSADAIAEIYKQECELSAKKRQTFWISTAGLLFGVGIVMIIGLIVRVSCMAETGEDMSMPASVIMAGLIIMFGSAGMIGGNILSRKLNKKKEN